MPRDKSQSAIHNPQSAIPLTLRLPFWLVDHGFHFKLLLSRTGNRTWAENYPLVEAFALSEPEKWFAKRLLSVKRNWWLYRCHQQAFCGDFVLIDMSAARVQQRPVTVMELKSRGPFKINDGLGTQMQNAAAAVEEIASTSGVVALGAEFTGASGTAQDVLNWLTSLNGAPNG